MYKIEVGLSALVVGLVILALAITSTTRTADAQGTDPLGSLRSSLGSAQGIDPLDSLRSSIDSSTIKMKNEANALISEIQATDLNNTGNVQDLIEKVYYYEGEVSVEGAALTDIFMTYKTHYLLKLRRLEKQDLLSLN